MPNITTGNRLYLYQLFKREIGTGRQELVARFEEVLEADGIAPADLGCTEVRDLLAQLDEMIKLTVFRRGRTYATLMRNEEYEGYLAARDDPTQRKAVQSGKSWKRKRANKVPKPAKPRHRRPEPTPEPEAESAAEAEPDANSEPEPKPEPEAESAVDAEPEAKAVPEAEAEPEAEQEVAHEPVPEADAVPEPAPAPRPAPESQVPSISLTITYDPADDPDAQAASEAEAALPQEGSFSFEDQHPSAPADVRDRVAPATREAAAGEEAATGDVPADLSRQSDLPQSISLDVHLKDELLRKLYQMLPLDVDIMGVLDEDWQVARSTALLTGTHSRVTFPLRYLHGDGTPVQVTLRRSAKPGPGKRWSIAYVDGDDGTGSTHELVGFEGLPTGDEGAWSELAGPGLAHADAQSPVRELARFAMIGSWDTYLGTLATMATPERWDFAGEGVGHASRYGVLREYLAVTFHRARETDAIAYAPDGSLAAFDTGLLTPFGQDVYACFSPNRGGIEWRAAGFCVAGSGRLGGELVAKLDPLPRPVSYLRGLADVAYDPSRLTVLDTDAVVTSRLGCLPRAFLEDELASSPTAERALAELEGDADGSATAEGDALTRLSRAIKGDPGLYRRLGRSLEAALDLTLARARQSYRLAAPAYDVVSGQVRLLLPLCLVSDDHADCALVLAPQPSGNYRGVTVLSPDRARACARVVSKELPRWLTQGERG